MSSSELLPHVPDNLPQLLELYNESYLFAKKVGDIDWIYPFPQSLLGKYIDQSQLFGVSFAVQKEVVSSVRLFDVPERLDTLFIGKLAVSRLLKGLNFTEQVLLPEIVDEAQLREKTQISLTCLADNGSLLSFYQHLGFVINDYRQARSDSFSPRQVAELYLEI